MAEESHGMGVDQQSMMRPTWDMLGTTRNQCLYLMYTVIMA